MKTMPRRSPAIKTMKKHEDREGVKRAPLRFKRKGVTLMKGQVEMGTGVIDHINQNIQIQIKKAVFHQFIVLFGEAFTIKLCM